MKSRILRGRRALKELLEPLLGERHAPVHKVYGSGAGTREQSFTRPPFGLGLGMAYLTAANYQGNEEELRPDGTREDQP